MERCSERTSPGTERAVGIGEVRGKHAFKAANDSILQSLWELGRCEVGMVVGATTWRNLDILIFGDWIVRRRQQNIWDFLHFKRKGATRETMGYDQMKHPCTRIKREKKRPKKKRPHRSFPGLVNPVFIIRISTEIEDSLGLRLRPGTRKFVILNRSSRILE